MSPEGDTLVMLSTNENQGPSEEADAEFAKELAKMLSDTSDSRKVDKKTALAMWDNTILPTASGGRKKKVEDDSDTSSSARALGVMNFTVLSRRGNKQQVCTNAYTGLSSVLNYCTFRLESYLSLPLQTLRFSREVHNCRTKLNSSS